MAGWIPGEPENDIRVWDTVEVNDPQGHPPANIIKRTDYFDVGIKFEILSPTAQAVLCVLTYEVTYSAESIGVGQEIVLGTTTRRTVDGVYLYDIASPPGSETVFRVPAYTLDEGVYRLSALVRFFVECPDKKRRYPLTGFAEGPAIEIYQP